MSLACQLLVQPVEEFKHDCCLNPANLRELGMSSQPETELWGCGVGSARVTALALAVSFDITCLVRGLSFPHSSFCLFWFVNLWELQLVALASSPH